MSYLLTSPTVVLQNCNLSSFSLLMWCKEPDEGCITQAKNRWGISSRSILWACHLYQRCLIPLVDLHSGSLISLSADKSPYMYHLLFPWWGSQEWQKGLSQQCLQCACSRAPGWLSCIQSISYNYFLKHKNRSVGRQNDPSSSLGESLKLTGYHCHGKASWPAIQGLPAHNRSERHTHSRH